MTTLPMTRVVVMEDRAQIERGGAVALDGLTRVVLAGMPPIAVDRSLKVEVRGGSCVDAKFERRWRERPKGGLPVDASQTRRHAEQAERELTAKNDAVARAFARIEVIAAARADLLRSIAEQTGVGQTNTSAWAAQLDLLSTQMSTAELAHRALTSELSMWRTRVTELKAAIALAEQPENELECSLVLSLQGHGEAHVKVSYMVPCAVWRPAYRASLTGQTVRVEAEAVVWQRTGEAWPEVALQFSTARPTLGTAPPQLTDDRLQTRPKQAVEKKVVDVSLREEVIHSAGEPGGGTTELPGLDDGGEARLLEGPARSTIPADGQPHRVPLFAFEAPATLERVCPAELTRVVSLVARLPNTSGQVLLAGPVDVIRQNGFVGRSQLKFTAPGELLKLSFGSEDGLQIVRTTEEKVDEARLTGRRTTTRKVLLYVSNARPESATLVIEERVPVSEVKDVEVQVLKAECSPTPSALSKDGIARLELSLPPHGTHVATFTWELQAAAKVSGV